MRWDIEATTTLPDAPPLRIAHQIRQDIWRACRNVRGFAPVVEITQTDGQLHIRAGGQTPHPSAHATDLCRNVLNCAKNRNRWLTHALHALALCGVLSALPKAQAEPVPSGQALDLHEELIEDRSGIWFLYLGYHAPDLIAQRDRIGPVGIDLDLETICESVLARRESMGDPWEGISELTVRFMSKPLNFGQSDASVAQVMGFYDLSGGDCAWL